MIALYSTLHYMYSSRAAAAALIIAASSQSDIFGLQLRRESPPSNQSTSRAAKRVFFEANLLEKASLMASTNPYLSGPPPKGQVKLSLISAKSAD